MLRSELKCIAGTSKTMGDEAHDFFRLIVDPAIDEFKAAEEGLVAASIAGADGLLAEAQVLVLRRARTAAIELHQFTDRVIDLRPAWAPVGGADALREWLMKSHCRRRPDDVLVLHDVADAFKHAVLTTPRRGRSWLLQSDKAVVTTRVGWGHLSWGEARWGGVEQTLVEQEDGRKRALECVLGTVREAWLSAMKQTP